MKKKLIYLLQMIGFTVLAVQGLGDRDPQPERLHLTGVRHGKPDAMAKLAGEGVAVWNERIRLWGEIHWFHAHPWGDRFLEVPGQGRTINPGRPYISEGKIGSPAHGKI